VRVEAIGSDPVRVLGKIVDRTIEGAGAHVNWALFRSAEASKPAASSVLRVLILSKMKRFRVFLEITPE
jgi:hypothetical protein